MEKGTDGSGLTPSADAARLELEEAYEQLRSVRAQLERSEMQRKEDKEAFERYFSEVYRRLENGTLHIIYCNGNHDREVGADGMICNCYLGQVIRGLRSQIKELEASAAKPAERSDAEQSSPVTSGLPQGNPQERNER